MKEHGILAWPKKVEEMYWHSFVQHPHPHLLRALPHLQGDSRGDPAETGLFADLDLEDYQPVPDWRPCESHTETRPEFDLTAIYFRVPYQSFSMTGNNAFLDEVSAIDPYAENVNINAATAAQQGHQGRRLGGARIGGQRQEGAGAGPGDAGHPSGGGGVSRATAGTGPRGCPSPAGRAKASTSTACSSRTSLTWTPSL